MKTLVHFYGHLAEITSLPNLEVDDVKDTDSVIKKLQELFPEFNKVKFTIAVDNNLITGNKMLSEENNIALMPPFSGG